MDQAAFDLPSHLQLHARVLLKFPSVNLLGSEECSCLLVCCGVDWHEHREENLAGDVLLFF